MYFELGNSVNSTQLAELCGNTVGSYTSTQQHMFIRFVTDHTLTKKGFMIEYYSTEGEFKHIISVYRRKSKKALNVNPFDRHIHTIQHTWYGNCS